MQKLMFLVKLLLVVAAFSVQAKSVTSLAGSTSYAFAPNEDDPFGAGPVTIAPGITWSSNNPNQFGSVFGYTGSYSFGGVDGNGEWSGMSMIGVNDLDSTMRIDFATPVLGVGAFLNYAPDEPGSRANISVYDKENELLGSTTLKFLTGGAENAGKFLGFLQKKPQISYITFTGQYIAASRLEVVRAIPEPESYALVVAGLCVVGGAARRRLQAQDA